MFFQHKKENNALLNKAQLVRTPVSDLIVKQQKMWIHTMQFLVLLIQPSWVLSQGLYQVLNQRLLISKVPVVFSVSAEDSNYLVSQLQCTMIT